MNYEANGKMYLFKEVIPESDVCRLCAFESDELSEECSSAPCLGGYFVEGTDEQHPEQSQTQLAASRYEYTRTLSPREFSELWEKALKGNFDDLVDIAITLKGN